MLIRAARSEDIPAMQAIEKHAATAAHWTDSDYLKIFESPELQTDWRRIALVIEEDKLQGFLVAQTVGGEWEIENVAIAADARRRGLGTRLVGELLDMARAQGASAVFLEVRESNRAARALYEKWAFVESGRRRQYYREPEEDAVVFKFTFAS
ncbi:MAG: ribosomal protein S18-alanine N-acetyltransferase [Candidatus Koribacter versatilis]|uniref:[Ribosomal protein bS18]-alanine N-acetyltransferase n=1 Tax=Candidatus Korobacter versatilis TaxID=658062 RepID=A0A932A864_9BACT|nr:ribosomal protein S18-alanine N-acetyltransferase [Candidatus Koribacter versatilis]